MTYHSIKVLEQQHMLSSLKSCCWYMKYAEIHGNAEQKVSKLWCFMVVMNKTA